MNVSSSCFKKKTEENLVVIFFSRHMVVRHQEGHPIWKVPKVLLGRLWGIRPAVWWHRKIIPVEQKLCMNLCMCNVLVGCLDVAFSEGGGQRKWSVNDETFAANVASLMGASVNVLAKAGRIPLCCVPLFNPTSSYHHHCACFSSTRVYHLMLVAEDVASSEWLIMLMLPAIMEVFFPLCCLLMLHQRRFQNLILGWNFSACHRYKQLNVTDDVN